MVPLVGGVLPIGPAIAVAVCGRTEGGGGREAGDSVTECNKVRVTKDAGAGSYHTEWMRGCAWEVCLRTGSIVSRCGRSNSAWTVASKYEQTPE